MLSSGHHCHTGQPMPPVERLVTVPVWLAVLHQYLEQPILLGPVEQLIGRRCPAAVLVPPDQPFVLATAVLACQLRRLHAVQLINP